MRVLLETELLYLTTVDYSMQMVKLHKIMAKVLYRIKYRVKGRSIVLG
jgi:hypothetical protein